MQVSSYEQHLSEAQAASFQALQDQLHSFQNDMTVAALLRTQLVDKDRQVDTIRSLQALHTLSTPHANMLSSTPGSSKQSERLLVADL